MSYFGKIIRHFYDDQLIQKDQKDDEIARLVHLLAQRDAELDQKNAELDQKNAELDQKNVELTNLMQEFLKFNEKQRLADEKQLADEKRLVDEQRLVEEQNAFLKIKNVFGKKFRDSSGCLRTDILDRLTPMLMDEIKKVFSEKDETLAFVDYTY